MTGLRQLLPVGGNHSNFGANSSHFDGERRRKSLKVLARMHVQTSDVDTHCRQLRLPRANANTRSTRAQASILSSYPSATLRKENKRARLSRWCSATSASRRSCGSERKTKGGRVKRRAEKDLLKIPLSARSRKGLTSLTQIRREAPTKRPRGEREAIDGSALHGHDHPFGKNPGQTRDGGAVLEPLNSAQFGPK